MSEIPIFGGQVVYEIVDVDGMGQVARVSEQKVMKEFVGDLDGHQGVVQWLQRTRVVNGGFHGHGGTPKMDGL